MYAITQQLNSLPLSLTGKWMRRIDTMQIYLEPPPNLIAVSVYNQFRDARCDKTRESAGTSAHPLRTLSVPATLVTERFMEGLGSRGGDPCAHELLMSRVMGLRRVYGY